MGIIIEYSIEMVMKKEAQFGTKIGALTDSVTVNREMEQSTIRK